MNCEFRKGVKDWVDKCTELDCVCFKELDLECPLDKHDETDIIKIKEN
jgi:hypothetical protein